MRYHHSPIRHLLVCFLMRFLQSSVDAVYTNVKLQCVGAEDVFGTLQTELIFHSKEGGGSTFLPAYTDLCSDSTKFDDGAQRVYFCKNCLTNCRELVEQAPKNILIVADVKAPNSRVSWFHVQPQNMNSIRETGKQCNVESQNPNSSANMEETSTDALRSFSKTSVLFVSISFIILMVISLAWLVFYYVQRFRYAHAKDRLQRRLFNAARKALTKIPTTFISPATLHEFQTDCAVCLEPYALQDCIRVLHCKHVYHKSCIDPWLLEHRTCPMCKSDILKSFGNMTEDCGVRYELGDDPLHHHHHHYHHHRIMAASDAIIVSPEPNSESSDSQGFSFDHSEHTENFSFSTPTVAPQLVLNASNAKSFVMPMSSRSSASALDSTSRPLTSSTATTNLSNFRPIPMSCRSTKEQRGSLTDLAGIPPPRAVRPMSGGAVSPGASPGQIVNLVQVKSRSASITRAATIRKESLPTPIEITTTIPATGSSTSSAATTTTTTTTVTSSGATSANTQTV